MIRCVELARPLATVDAEAKQERVNTQVWSAEKKIVTHCVECGGPLRYQSFDPCEGYFYRCVVCWDGPYGPYQNLITVDPVCDDCDRIVCSVRGENIHRCRDYHGPGILQRTLANTPPNESRIRGVQ
jgi:hypothetical protein